MVEMTGRATARGVLSNAEVRAEVFDHAMRSYPKECCGLLVARAGRPAAVLAENLLDRAHADDPEAFPRTGETGFLMDGRLVEDAPLRGEDVVAVFHSHVEAGAYFSAEDRRMATSPWGGPLWPGLAHVVLDARAEGVRGFKVFSWDERARDFVET
jgi:proteasome lid subunit RPN8/RPN11